MEQAGDSSLASRGKVTSWLGGGAGSRGAPVARRDIGPPLADLYEARYPSLYRPAVLLTCDADVAEAVVPDCFAALYRLRRRPQTESDAMAYLRRLLVARSRLARRHHPWDGSRRPPRGRGCLAAPTLRTSGCGRKARP